MSVPYSFKQQIDADIKEYQSKYSYYPNMAKDEWAFNFWVLYNFFTEDESMIGEKIVDYHDLGVDAYEIYEDTNDVYLIQNKYYSEGNKIATEYVSNDFLIRAITALENGTYKRSEALQRYFTKNKDKPDFMVHLQLFITNNDRNADAEKAIKEWNLKHPKYFAQIFYLDNIREKYYKETVHKAMNWECRISSINKGTVLNINSDDYKLKNILDARYVFTPVYSLYEIYKQAQKDGYAIFDENIREYLGNKGINKGIYTTLMDPDERHNFFYYNNGITIICDAMEKMEVGPVAPNMNISFKIKNPQIVNGCQTVNSIFQALDNMNPEDIQEIFADTFVMVKILRIDGRNEDQQALYKNIVRFNNSQNNIDEKNFVSNTALFTRLQKMFKERGFLIQIKQSDKHKFTEMYKKSTSDSLRFRELSQPLMNHFLVSDKTANALPLIDLAKLLQVILAFADGGYRAYTKKPNLLKYNTEEYKIVTDFIQNNTVDTIINLYMLYLTLEDARKDSADQRTPIVYYAIDLFGKYECSNRDSSLVVEKLADSDYIFNFIKIASLATKMYIKKKQKENAALAYNDIIKMEIDYDQLGECYDICKETI